MSLIRRFGKRFLVALKLISRQEEHTRTAILKFEPDKGHLGEAFTKRRLAVSDLNNNKTVTG